MNWMDNDYCYPPDPTAREEQDRAVDRFRREQAEAHERFRREQQQLHQLMAEATRGVASSDKELDRNLNRIASMVPRDYKGKRNPMPKGR